MTSMTDMTADAIDYLVAQCQASSVLGSASPPVTVFDGPEPSSAQLVAGKRIWIGHDPMSPSGPGAESSQTWSFLDGARTRDETGRILCAAEEWSGDTTMKTHRDAVKTLVGSVALLLRGLPSNGGPGDATMGGVVRWSQVTGPLRWYPRQGQDGAGLMCVFEIGFSVRLTS